MAGLKCIEYNITSNLGGWWLPIWESLYLQNPLISGFINSHKLKITDKNLMSIILGHFIETTLEYFPNENEMNLAVLVHDRELVESMAEPGKYANRVYKDCLQRNRLKGDVIFCTSDELDMTGEYLYHKDKKVHALYDFCFGDVPAELLPFFKKGNVLILNGPVGGLMSNKLKLALLSEHEDSDLFTPGEKETIKKYIPWTRKVVDGITTYGGEKIKLKDFLLSHREKLVLKPARGMGGENVHVGHYIPESQWETLVSEALLGEPWVAQERIEFPPFLLQWGENGCTEHDIAWGVFVLGNRYGGVLLRGLPRQNSNGIINTRQGAWSSLVFEVDE